MKQSIACALLVIVFSLNSGPVTAQEKEGIQHLFNNWTEQEILKHASIGFYAQDAETGEVLAESNPQLSMAPASTLKLLTTSTALELLGANYHFETRLAYSGEIKNDTLYGDLVIVGGGDPALGSKYFKNHKAYLDFVTRWAAEVSNFEIHFITGDLIVDASVYDDQSIPDTWIWEDMGNYYGAGTFGLSAYDNTCELHFSSPAEAGEPTKLLYTLPVIPGITFENQVLSSNENRDAAYVFGSPLDNRRVLRGTIPKNKSDFAIKASLPNPPLLVGTQLQQELAIHGIKLAGKIQCTVFEKPEVLHTLSIIQSPALADIISVTNHESVNLFAEHILKQIAVQATGLGTSETGIDLVREFWEQHGLDTKALFMEDGSGLSRFDAITPQQLVFVLNYMKNTSVNSKAFFNSLPAVPAGTLWYFNRSFFPQKTLRAKSGSMTRVRCFAGQLTTIDQHEILFAVFLNNFSCSQSQAIKAIEKLLVEIRSQ